LCEAKASADFADERRFVFFYQRNRQCDIEGDLIIIMLKIAKTAGILLLCFVAIIGVIIYQRSSPPPEFKTYRGIKGVSSNDLLSVKMERMAEQAAMDAWARCHIGVRIDVQSLQDFERYLGLVSQSSQFKNYPSKDKQAEAIIDGAFVGEAIRRTHGGNWMEKSDLPDGGLFPLNTDGKINYPITWCLKRLVNGPEENIYKKYVFFILQRTNEFHGEITYWTNTPSGLKEITNIVVK
jgi:hypothetical protein